MVSQIKISHLASSLCHLRIEIAPKSNSEMMWRPNAIQLPNIRPNNVASFFAENDLKKNGALKKAGSFFFSCIQLPSP